MKVGFCAVVGRPSAGKSSLINLIVGQKVSIVSNVPQTTRNLVRGIYTAEQGQIVFLDTPGYHAATKKINRYLTALARNSLNDADLIIYVADTTRPAGEEENLLCELLRPYEKKIIVVLNKIDLNNKYLSELKTFISLKLKPLDFCPISALTGEGKNEILDLIFRNLAEGEAFYPAEFYTDQEVEFRIAELVRESLFKHTREEIPHCGFVEIVDSQFIEKPKTLKLRGFIYVERESQKGIVIGKEGELIKKIVKEAEAEADRLFPYKIKLDFRVKVKPRWRRDDKLLKRLIHLK